MKDWYESTTAIASATVEIGFMLSPEFSICSDGIPSLTVGAEPLKLPTFHRASEHFATTTEAQSHTSELIAYYADVIRLARKYSNSFRQISPYFWMRLSIANTDGTFEVSFPWYDTLREMAPVLTKLVNPPTDGEIHGDIEQGWGIEMDAFNCMLYIREWCSDTDEVHVAARLPLLALSSSSKDALGRARKIIATLTTALTEDAWTGSETQPTFSKLVLAKSA